MPDDLESPDNEHQPDDNAVIKELRQKAGRTEAAESRAQALERELVVHKAGLTGLTDKQHKALAAAHDGEWEPDLLKATAIELGFGPQPDTEPPAPQVPPDELAAMQRVATASGGQPAPPTDFDAALVAAATPEERHNLLRSAGLLAEE